MRIHYVTQDDEDTRKYLAAEVLGPDGEVLVTVELTDDETYRRPDEATIYERAIRQRNRSIVCARDTRLMDRILQVLHSVFPEVRFQLDGTGHLLALGPDRLVDLAAQRAKGIHDGWYTGRQSTRQESFDSLRIR